MSQKDGVKHRTTFVIDGKNKDAREAAECNAVSAIKRMVCSDGHEYLCSYYNDPIIKK